MTEWDFAGRSARRGAWALAALGLSGCIVAPVSVERVAPIVRPAGVPAGMQYLYGSGEAAAGSIQTWRTLMDFVANQKRTRPRDSVVLDEDATLAAPRFMACGGKPLAAVFDVDETVLLNLGYEADDAAHPGGAYDETRWADWERTGAGQVTATPGAKGAIDALRVMGVTVVFNSNRSAANAVQTEAALTGAGLGPAKHGETLFLKGDDTTGSAKDARRAAIAARYCVVAMVGDQLGDFSDQFNAGLSPPARRAAVSTTPLWGAGWFVLPNPVYGSALKGTLDEVFPADRRWTPAR